MSTNAGGGNPTAGGGMQVGGMGGAGPAQGPTAGPGGAGGSTGMGGAGGDDCTETPCKLTLPQCGCPMGQRCWWNSGTSQCIADGTQGVGDPCGVGQQCAAGGHCLTIGSLGVCKAYCDSDNDCDGGGGLCVIEVEMSPGVPYPQKWCSDNCDMPSGVGCTAPGSKCELGQEQGGAMRYWTYCVPSGAGVQNSPCPGGALDCANGYGCIGNDGMNNNICLQWCQISNPQCLSGICTAFPAPGVFVGNVEYGGCL